MMGPARHTVKLRFLLKPRLDEGSTLHRTYPFHDLSSDEFEQLICAICHVILGTGTIVFAAGRDGGRDARFVGVATKFPSESSPLQGKFIVQAKHTGNPVASCSDREFGRLVEGEHPKVVALIKGGEVEHYLVFTNRKKPATDATRKEKALCKLGLKTAHILGSEQLRDWLTLHPKIWRDLGFDRFETPLRFQTSDITTVVSAFHAAVGDWGLGSRRSEDFSYVPKPEKNRINKLSAPYFEEIRTRSLPYFRAIEEFLSNPRNLDYKDMYEDTADEIRRKLIAMPMLFESFDAALTYIIDQVIENNTALRQRRRFAAVFLHYMYYTCDIGQHADAVQTS
jgi:C-terminal domain 12 of the ABC-three component (ABC-3C) systems